MILKIYPRKAYNSLLIFFILACHVFVFSQGNVALGSISCKEELEKASITDILQGPKGFMWFSTYDGLCRYDGYKCLAYKYDPEDNTSISTNDLNCLYLDSKGVLWVGTYNGLNRFDRVTGTFKRFLYDKDDPLSLSHNVVSVIYEDKMGNLWIGTLGGGLNLFNRQTGKSRRFIHDAEKSSSLSNNHVNSICEDSRGMLWIGTKDGLNRWSAHKKAFKRYHPQGRPARLKSNHIGTIYEDSNGNLWIGTWGGGLWRFLRDKDQFVYYFIKMPRPEDTGVDNININSICEYHFDSLWVGTYGNGLYKFSKEKESFEPLRQDIINSQVLNSKFIHKIYKDKSGLLWIGMEAGGINIYDKKKEKFSHFTHYPLDKNSLSNEAVLSLCETPGEEGDMLLAGTYSGLNFFDRKKNKFTHFKHNPADSYSISNDVIRFIFIDSEKVCWIATDKGLNQLNYKTYTFESLKNDPGNIKSISSDKVRSICEDKKKQIWIGTVKGLNLFKRKEKFFIRFVNEPGDSNSLSNNHILCMSGQVINGESVLWIGTYKGGLNKFFIEKDKFYYYNTTESETGVKLSSNIIRTIYIDRDSILWLGTDGGLIRFDPIVEECMVYSEKEGLSSNRVYGILEDESGYLWVSTYDGLNRFEKKTGEFKSFNQGSGVPIRKFNLGACYKSRTGELFFGGMNGFISFFPETVEINKNIPSIVITDFKIFNQSQGIGDFLKTSVTEAAEIIVTHKENMFSFEFAALDYTWSENNQYKYKMEGFDKDWIETDAQNRLAQYTNLSHGEYTFKVKGSNNDGIWNENEISLKIVITPPFFKTWWFKIVVGSSLILFLLLFYLQRTRWLRKKLLMQQRIQEILKKSHEQMEQARDLAEFRRAEIEKLISAISSLLIAVDSNGKIFQLNEAAEKFFDIPISKTNGQSFVDVLKDYISIVRLNMMLEKGLGKDNSPGNFEIPTKCKHGGVKLLLGIINPLLDRDGQKLGFLLLAEDITHRKEDETRRNLAQKLESLGKMAGNIAHEIKTPLQYIGNNGYFIDDAFENMLKFFDTLKLTLKNMEKSDPLLVMKEIEKNVKDFDIEYILEEGPKASDQIVRGVSRLSTIIQSMLTYTHPGRGVMEHADIHELFETTLVFIRSHTKEVSKIETEFCQDLPQVFCYPGELIQVFMNLLINAADAIREKGAPGLIRITTTLNENEIIITITDSGCGIPESIKENIYNPFFTTKEVGKGTGQGLTLVHNIVTEKHNGKIYFSSQPGEGTTFFVHLPLPPEEPGCQQNPPGIH